MLIFTSLILIHVLFLLSIFEIYFKSPIIENIPLSEKARGIQLAKRVVIFYADGVRAEKFYEITDRNTSHSPYLRKLLGENHACGGIAHTRVPTETRPGAIAMLAGFYEDPSAIFKGWQDNPVEFDHIFNQSDFSVAFGSPDVLKMFSRGFRKSDRKRFHFEFYNENEQQFKNETQLNYWVGNKTLQYLSSKVDSSSLNQDRVIMLLHFLGPDTAGHNFKPNSKEYSDNILSVDRIVQAVVRSISNYYGHDNHTAFIYSSDHGMTDWGSHGDGSDHETETPFIAWGAGVGCSSYLPSRSSPPTFLPSANGRLDIAQVDMVSLVSTLLGVPIPVHSVGQLPLQYLSLDISQQARVMHSNAIQIHNAYRTLRLQRRESVAKFLFTPFHELSENEEAMILGEIEKELEQGNYELVISQSNLLISLSLQGLTYFHTYYQVTLLSCVSLAYLGLLYYLFRSAGNTVKIADVSVKFGAGFYVVLTGVLVYSYSLGLPLQSYVFTMLPVFVWFGPRIPDTKGSILQTVNIMFVLKATLYAGGVLMLVFTFFHRWILSILLLCLSLLHLYNSSHTQGVSYSRAGSPRYSNIQDGRNHASPGLKYALTMLPLAVFPLLPIVGTQETNKYLLILAGISWLVYSIYIGLFKDGSHFPSVTNVPSVLRPLLSASIPVLSAPSSVLRIQQIIQGVTIVHVALWSGDPYRMQLLVSWLILVISPLTILFSPSEPKSRLLSIGLGLAPPFILLCASYEVFFILCLLVHLSCWFDKETKGVRSSHPLTAFLLLVYLFTCFFGLGNIASISSYDWNCVRFFLTVFSPFTMLSFFVVKILVPFLLVSCAVRAVHLTLDGGEGHVLRTQTDHAEIVLQLVLGFCDMMGLVFLFLVKNTGSWKDIGLSISHVVIVHCITLALMCLYTLACYLMPARREKRRY